MANTLKYNSSTSESFSFRKGNFYIGTGDVVKGPTMNSGFWNGSDFTGVPYVIYLNKENLGPSIYAPISDADLVTLTNKISGSSFSPAAECLAWFSTQSDKMVVNI